MYLMYTQLQINEVDLVKYGVVVSDNSKFNTTNNTGNIIQEVGFNFCK